MTEKNVKNTNTWRLNNTLPNNQGITEETKEELIKYLDTNDKKKKKKTAKPTGHGKNSSEMEVYSNTVFPQETR